MGDLAVAAVAADGNQSESQTSSATTTSDAGTVGEASEVQAPAWTAQLPDDLKANEKLTQYTKLGDLGRAFLDADGRLASSIEVPGEGATEEQVAEFRKKLGVPGAPKDYALKDLEDLPDIGMKLQDDSPDWFEGMAHKAGLSKDQAKVMYREFVSRVSTQVSEGKAQKTAAAKATEKVLQEEYKERYPAMMSQAKAFVKNLGGEEFANYLNETGLSNDPRMIRFMFKGAQLIGNDSIPSGEVVGATPQRGDRLRDAANFEFPESSKHWKR